MVCLPAGWMRRQFGRVVKAEVNQVWKEKGDKNNTKKNHLESKHKPKKEENVYRGIPIGDEELGEDVDKDEVVVAHGVH